MLQRYNLGPHASESSLERIDGLHTLPSVALVQRLGVAGRQTTRLDSLNTCVHRRIEEGPYVIIAVTLYSSTQRTVISGEQQTLVDDVPLLSIAMYQLDLRTYGGHSIHTSAGVLIRAKYKYWFGNPGQCQLICLGAFEGTLGQYLSSVLHEVPHNGGLAGATRTVDLDENFQLLGC